MEDFREKVLELHKKNIGKLDILPSVKIRNSQDLSLAYSPGVAIACEAIADNKDLAYTYTSKGKTVAIVTDGSAVLGLGNIGPEAALPVMEGKAVLLQTFSGIQAVPICLDTLDDQEIIKTVKYLAPNYSAIMLEDIQAPKCVYIEEALQKELPIPVFHDDQHGTAIVVSAALLNALKIVKKSLDSIKIVVSGSGAAGSAIIKLLNHLGAKMVYNYNIFGVVNNSSYERNDRVVKSLVNRGFIKVDGVGDTLSEIIRDTDVFIGVSAKNILTKEMVKSMNKDPIVFALANPDPEIDPFKAKEAGARIIGTGRSDYPNQINNVLAFPGLMKGVIKAQKKVVNTEIKIAACKALQEMIPDNDLHEENLLPDIFNKAVVDKIADAIIALK